MKRRATMRAFRQLPSGVEWTGLRRTMIYPTTRAHPNKPRNALSRADKLKVVEASDLEVESDGTDSDMPALEPLVVPAAQSARAVLAEINHKPQGKHRVPTPLQARPTSEDQPTVFTQEEQGHKRRTQRQCESTPPE